MEMKKYIEIINLKTSEVVKRINVSKEHERTIERVIDGMNINLNHNEYYVTATESPTELPII